LTKNPRIAWIRKPGSAIVRDGYALCRRFFLLIRIVICLTGWSKMQSRRLGYIALYATTTCLPHSFASIAGGVQILAGIQRQMIRANAERQRAMIVMNKNRPLMSSGAVAGVCWCAGGVLAFAVALWVWLA